MKRLRAAYLLAALPALLCCSGSGAEFLGCAIPKSCLPCAGVCCQALPANPACCEGSSCEQTATCSAELPPQCADCTHARCQDVPSGMSCCPGTTCSDGC